MVALAVTAAPPAALAVTTTGAQARAVPSVWTSGAGDWPQYRDGPTGGAVNLAETVLSPSTVSGLHLLGQGHSATFTGGQVGATSHGLFYRGGPNGGIAAYDEATGKRQWTAAMGSNQIAIGGNVLYTVDPGGGVYAYRADSGAPLWHRSLGQGVYDTFPPTLFQSRLLVGVERVVRRTDVSEVVSLNPSSGAPQWRTRVASGAGAGQVSHIAAQNGTAVLNVRSAKIVALNLSTGAVRWAYDSGGWGGGITVSSPVIKGTTVFDGLVDGVFRALDLATGKVKWSRALGDNIWTAATMGNGKVYVAASSGLPNGGDLFALDPATGAVRWSETSGSDNCSPTLANGVIYVGTYFGGDALKAYDAGTGALLGAWPVSEQLGSEALVSHGKVYLMGDSGTVFVFGL